MTGNNFIKPHRRNWVPSSIFINTKLLKQSMHVLSGAGVCVHPATGACVYLVVVQQSVCGVQQSVCFCVSLCSVAQLCVCVLQCFHANGEGERQGAEPVVNHHPSRQEIQ